MTTLVISDLHLGNRGRRDILRLPEVRQRLFAALDGVERLVLLGDTLELVNRRPDRSMAIAEPVLRELGRRLGPEREVVIVPGNHDRPLVSGWARATGPQLRVDHGVPPDASPALARIVSWLAPARVEVRYPGVWLAERIWATHGHYLDHHLFPTSAFGLPRLGSDGRRVPGPAGYELADAHRRSTARPQRHRGHPAALARRVVMEAIGLVAFRAPRVLLRNGMAPVTARIIDTQMRHAAIGAMARVAEDLQIDADAVIFGHVHRRGPLAGESWPHPEGARYLNTGSWMREPLLIDRASAPHPYWPGGAVIIGDDGSPRSIGLLDELGPAAIRPPGRITPAA